jgi:hypothetical protein
LKISYKTVYKSKLLCYNELVGGWNNAIMDEDEDLNEFLPQSFKNSSNNL